jgi:hypothetical protein
VHGTAQEQLGRNALLRAWEPALRDGLEIAFGSEFPRPRFRLAFYGDLFLSAADEGTPVNAAPTRPGLAETLVAAEEVDFLESAADEVTEGQPDLGEPMGFTPVPTPLVPVLRTMARHFDVRTIMPFFPILRQVRLYQQDDTLAGQIRDRVLATIGDGCAVLIGHSMGTMVAFETLTLNPDLHVDTLITYGAPLSMRTVAAGLRGPAAPNGLPNLGQVRQWVNIYDPKDPVCGAGGVKHLWPTALDIQVSNGEEPHSITRYLSKKASGRVIATAIEATR